MSIKQGVAQATLLFPLPFVILICWRYTESKFKLLSENMPLSSALDADANTTATETTVAEFVVDYFLQPNLKTVGRHGR